MERQKFEDSWKSAFENAEVSPSDNVWTNIELDLEKARGSKLKRKLVLFQLLAAASFIFALGVGVGVYVMGVDAPTSTQTAEKSINEKTVAPPQTTTSAEIKPNPSQNQIASNDQTSTQRTTAEDIADRNSKTASTSLDENENPSEDRAMPPALNETGKEGNESFASVAQVQFDATSMFASPRPVIPIMEKEKSEEVVADPVALMLAKLEAREKEIQKKEEAQKASTAENLWTSVGFAAGSFNPVNSGVNASSRTMAMSQNSTIANQEVKASGVTYSVGANVGTKLSDRWVFQGGVNYLTQSSDYTANNVVSSSNFQSFRPVTISDLENMGEDEAQTLVTTSPYSVNNSLRYLSIPLQAGYLIIDRDFGFQLNAGIATDVFLQNTVTAEGQNVDATTQEIGEDTPYRAVNLSGLMGGEISYRFAERYRISINPGLRYPFNSIYRSELAVKATPLTFDVGLRFRYIFR